MINKQLIHMFKITEYFYILTKLATSIVLILIIFFMSYIILISYKDNDLVDQNYDLIINNLDSKMDENNRKLTTLDNNLNNIQKKIAANKSNIRMSEFENDIKELISTSNELKKKIKDISTNYKNNQSVAKPNIENEVLKVGSIVDLIVIKYKNFQKIKNELIFLESILPENKKIFLEKIYLINFNNFYGIKNLNKEFNISTENYINFRFLENNKNKAINFLYRFVKVRPSNLSIYENEDLNILMNAKKLIEAEDVKGAIMEIKKLKNSKDYFYEYINQSKIFLEFINALEKVK